MLVAPQSSYREMLLDHFYSIGLDGVGVGVGGGGGGGGGGFYDFYKN